MPRRQAWAREGLAEKWLQCVSDYWFAEAELRDVKLDGAEGVRFTFYLDPEEPWNSEEPRMNVNPEVIRCSFVA